jgi:hypothetical protein
MPQIDLTDEDIKRIIDALDEQVTRFRIQARGPSPITGKKHTQQEQKLVDDWVKGFQDKSNDVILKLNPQYPIYKG